MTVIDADAHLDEGPALWKTYSPSRDRELALTVTEDPKGYSWMTFRGRQLYVLDAFDVGNWSFPGELRQRLRAGIEIDERHRLANAPLHDRDPLARLAKMAEWGVDEAVLFPNRGFNWEAAIAFDVEAVRVNCAAWNRWAAEVAQAGSGRLHPVGHVTLEGGRTPWLEDQLRSLSNAGIRQTMVCPGLIGGLRPSDPAFDPVWQLFVENDMALAWHIQTRMASVFDRATSWTSNDRDSHVQLLMVLFAPTAAHLALADFAINGVFQRNRGLRVVTAELTSDWLAPLTARIDGLYQTWQMITGRPFNEDLLRLPSEYLREQTTVVCSFPTDVTPDIVQRMDELPNTFAFATDYPHPEGLSTLEEYRSRIATEVPEKHAPGFYGENIGAIVHR